VRVIDLGVLVAAPLAGAVLAALGAQLTPVAHAARKNSRWYGGPVLELNLGQQGDRTDFARLCRTADLVIDNFSPRVWGNFGFEPTELGAGLLVSLPAFAAGDPRRNYRAFGFQTEALFGVGCTPDPTVAGAVVAPRAALMDHAVGLVGAVYCLGAIAARRRGRLEVCHSDVAGLVS
jgi:crotonobetainyl-CoA:carnitine CoA-transferase CaiB-like acyl-CoA transferase